MELHEALEAIEASSKQFYVYIIRKLPIIKDEWTKRFPEGTPLYVGKGGGKGKRISIHEKEADSYTGPAYPPSKKTNLSKINTIKKIKKAGYNPVYDLEFYETPESAFEREKELIKEIGRKDLHIGPLTNLTSGGDGLTDPNTEVRSLIGSATKKRLSIPKNLQRLSKERTEYYSDPKNREKQSKAIKNAYKKNPDLLKLNRENQKVAQKKPEVVQKKSTAMKGYWSNEHWAKKIKEKQRRGWTPEKIEAKSERNKLWHSENPERVREMAEKRNKTLKTPTYRKKRSELTKKQIAEDNGELHRKSAEARRTPEYRKKRGEITRRLLKNPEIKKRQLDGQKRANAYRSAIRNRCLELVNKHNIDIELPYHACAIKTWEAFEVQLKLLAGRQLSKT